MQTLQISSMGSKSTIKLTVEQQQTFDYPVPLKNISTALLVIGTAFVPQLNTRLYVGTLTKHTVLLNEEQSVIGKDCSSCGSMYTLDEFYRDKYSLFNRTFTCKHCRAEVGQQFRKNNPKYYRRYLIDNRERAMERSKQWSESNPDKVSLYFSRNSGKRQEYLRNCFTDDTAYMEEITVDKSCAITGLTEDIALDHVMPVAVGRWGNTRGNLLWLTRKLNISKHSRNVFEWAEEMEQERLDYLLPETVNMTVGEFKKRLYEALTDKAAELDMTLETYKQEYDKEYYRR